MTLHLTQIMELYEQLLIDNLYSLDLKQEMKVRGTGNTTNSIEKPPTREFLYLISYSFLSSSHLIQSDLLFFVYFHFQIPITS